MQLDSAGNLLVNVAAGGGSGSNAAAGPTGSAVPADADYLGVNIGGTLTGVTGLSLANAKPATVAVVDASGNQITAFGGSGGNAAAAPTGAAVPADADYIGFNSGGNLVGVSSTNKLPVDGSGVTQPISAASLPLPAGAATAAKQPALGTAGTPSADVISVQGVVSMTALKVDGSTVTQPVSGTVTANAGTGPATAWKVDLSATGANATAIKVDGSAVTQPVSGTVSTTPPANASTNVTQLGGNAIVLDSAKVPFVNGEGQKAAYSAHATFTPVAGDIAVLPGSASKTIRVTRIEVSMSTTGTAAIEQIDIYKNSTADSGGTSAAMTAVPHDSNNAAASAAPLSYTAAPTLGTRVGKLRGIQFSDASAALPGANTWLWTFGAERGTQAIVLRGTAQQVAVNLGGAVATQTVTVSFEWTEE
ncbi:MAG TPA: hypothetical protein VFI60_05645 [Candidatus Acidoferrum sp.]|nr:hypothetical protein [Candidatus Acidoferrum sp.]